MSPDMSNTDIVREFYNNSVELEWKRLEQHPVEFAVTRHYIDQYVSPGDRVLDLGGGPGRYSLYLAQKGCRVTLLDLSDENITFAKCKVEEVGLDITMIQGDACEVDNIVSGPFDCILLMGPMYHLLEEAQRTKAMDAALRLLKPGGVIVVSFISLYAGLVDYMKNYPQKVLEDNEQEYIRCCFEDRTYCGDAFTKACLLSSSGILEFMVRFPLKKLHFFGQEGITSPCENNINACGYGVVKRWIEIALQTCEREEFLSYSEHLMFVGRLNG
jgi:S-adenosylmethionine-dependent methyltransferase